MKKLLILLLTLSLCTLPILADSQEIDYDTVVKKSLANSVYLLTIDATEKNLAAQSLSAGSTTGGLEYLLSINRQIEELEAKDPLTLTDEEKQFIAVYKPILAASGYSDGLSPEDKYSAEVTIKTLRAQLEAGRYQASLGYSVARHSLTYQVTNLYMNYLRMGDSYDLLNEQIKNLSKQYENALSMYRQGRLSNSQLEQIRLTKDKTDLEKSKLERNMDTVHKNLNKLCGFALSDNISYKKELTVKTEDISEITLEDATARALKNRSEVRTAKDNLEIKEVVFDIATSLCDLDSVDWLTARYEYIAAQQDLDETQSDIRKEIKTLMSESQTAKDTLAIAKKNLESAQTTYDQVSLYYKQGKIIETKVIDASMGLTDAKIKLTDAEWDLDILNYKFQCQIGIGGAI